MTTPAPITAARRTGFRMSWRPLLVRLPERSWLSLVALVGVVFAVVAVWVTLRAGFLAYPGWLAVQKADFILGPIGVGLYWRYRRPSNRFGLLLIGLGLAGVPYILTSSTDPTLFAVGAVAEAPIYMLTSAVILAFPSGRIEGVAAKVTLAVSVIFSVVATAVFILTDPQAGPSFSISGCRAACPVNGLAIWSTPAWLPTFNDVYGALLIAIPIATAGVLVWRFITGTPPRRRALSIGAPIALLFLAMQASYRFTFFLAPDGLALSNAPLHSGLQWTFAASRSFVWYGFLFALIAAELFAGRALSGLVRDSLGRPSLRELEAMLRGPLGDPGLRLGFWRPRTHDWADADREVLAPPGAGQALTEVQRHGRPAAAIVHDKQLAEDPELLQAAGAVALLALENAELDAAWQGALRELRDSRARITRASDQERRKLERDLHDGAQQRLMGVQIKLRLAQEQVDDDGVAARLEEVGVEAAEAVEELRTLAHGIYPPVLRSGGLVRALRSVAMTAPIPISVTDEGIGRCSPPVEAAIYYCSREAVQNAIKHAGNHVRVAVALGRDSWGVHFAISDYGVGMDVSARGEGYGLIGMRDRVGAVGGELEIISSPGRGTTVRGTIPEAATPGGGEQREGSG